MERKQVNFPVTSEEHEAIKKVAEKNGERLSNLFCLCLISFIPAGTRKKKKMAQIKTANPDLRLNEQEVEGGFGVRKERRYLLTRDAFFLLVMGFTGKAAIQWKLRYIEAFTEQASTNAGNSSSCTVLSSESAVFFLRTPRALSGRVLFFYRKFIPMTTATTDLWGQDIALDASGQALVAANGELVLTEGVDTGVQDVRLRLFTRLGTLFYDTDFGSLIHDWILEESTTANRAAFCAEVTLRVDEDPRVALGSVRCSVLKWDETQLVAQVVWRFIDEDQPMNLVLQLNKVTHELVIADAHPQAPGLSAHFSDD